MFDLYYYQKDALKAIRAKRKKNGTRALVVLATGGGKTLIAAEETKREIGELKGKMLILAHREKLLLQMKKEILFLYPEADVGIVGFRREEWGHDITLGGVQTLSRSEKRLERLARSGITYVITDESHHVLSSGYQTIHRYLAEGNPNVFCLGITATPDRGDNRDVSEFYGSPVYVKLIRELIEEKYLCDLKTFVIKTKTKLDTTTIRIGRDYNDSDLEYAINHDDRNVLIVQTCMNPEMGGPDIPTVCFCAGQDHAIELAKTFNSMGITAQALIDSTKDDERDQIYRDFASGKLKVITNVDVCSEGWDANVHRVCLCSPTKVRSRHCQRIGRCTRKALGKPFAYVIDFSDDCASHNLEPITLSDVFEMPIMDGKLFTEASKEERERKAVRDAEERKRIEILAQLLSDAELVNREVDILGKLPWKRTQDGWFVVKVENCSLVLAPAKQAGNYHIGIDFRKNANDPSNPIPIQKNVPQSWAMSIVEQKAKQIQAGDYSLVDPNAPWRNMAQTDEQRAQFELLKRRRKLDPYRVTSHLTRGEAADMLGKYMKKPTTLKRRKKKVQAS